MTNKKIIITPEEQEQDDWVKLIDPGSFWSQQGIMPEWFYGILLIFSVVFVFENLITGDLLMFMLMVLNSFYLCIQIHSKQLRQEYVDELARRPQESQEL